MCSFFSKQSILNKLKQFPKMVLTISQQTFNDAVQENINDLGLSPEEATTEAVSQFKAQGVDLSQIMVQPGESSNLENIMKKLTESKDIPDSQDCLDQLVALKQECDKGIQYRIQAGHAGAYNLLLDVLLSSNDKKDLQVLVISTLLSLSTKQPDLLDDRGAQIIMSNLQKTIDPEIQILTLKWSKECCVMHEMNRQKLVNMNIVPHLSTLLNNTDILNEVLSLLRGLILDDDVRVEFGRAHEHARIIASETLVLITDQIKSLKTDPLLVNDLILTLSSLLVRTEFCVKVEEAGVIEVIKELMTNFQDQDKITRQCFKLIKALAGNDECKVHMIQKGLASVICDSLNSQQSSVQTAIAGLGCVAAVSLRSPANSKALFEAAAPDAIVEVMKKYPDEKLIQKTASWAIRNMVSRSRYQNKHFLELGVEDLLQRNLGKFKDFEYDTKAALRDLECNVELKEEWTGKGGKISSETAITTN